MQRGRDIVFWIEGKFFVAQNELCIDGQKQSHDTCAETTIHGLHDIVAHEYACNAKTNQGEA